jgi:oligoribonuclease (3'-5' exoribonuclease)
MKHIMIDLETMGTRHDAPILSIGAVAFDPDTGALGATFEANIDPSDALANGKLSGDTLKWWMAQGDEARRAAMSGTSPLFASLYNLANWLRDTSGPEARVWGNGATFDITILERAYAKLGLEIPWHFRNVRDCRTIAEVAKGLYPDIPRPAHLVGHKAVDDAIYQAMWVSAAWQALRAGREPLDTNRGIGVWG